MSDPHLNRLHTIFYAGLPSYLSGVSIVGKYLSTLTQLDAAVLRKNLKGGTTIGFLTGLPSIPTIAGGGLVFFSKMAGRVDHLLL